MGLVSVLALVLLAPVPPSTTAKKTTAARPQVVLHLSVKRALGEIGTPVALTKLEQRRLRGIVNSLRSSEMERARAEWKALLEGYGKSHPEAPNVDALVGAVLRAVYLDGDEALAPLAAKVSAVNERKAAIERERGDASLARIAELDAELNTLGEDGQLFNIDLQNALQRQQQAMQAASNVAKLLNDTAKDVVDNMRSESDDDDD